MKSGKSIYSEVSLAIGKLIGKSVTEKMMDSVARFDSPKDNPKEFLESCRNVFTRFIGKRLVDISLKELYKEYGVNAQEP